jgi:hypothetical protein
MNLALASSPLLWNAVGSLVALFAFLNAAVAHPFLMLAVGGGGAISAALALAAPWRRFHAAPAHTAFIGS